MRKFLYIALLLFFYSFTSLFMLPSQKLAYAENEQCGPTFPDCPSGLTCIKDDPNEDSSPSHCTTPPLNAGDPCDVSKTECVGDLVCSPDAPGSATGTCKALTEGITCDTNNKEGCGASTTTPYRCKPDPNNAGQNICQLTDCDPANGSKDCKSLGPNYYCVEAIDGTSTCQASTNDPNTPQKPNGPQPPCAIPNKIPCPLFRTGLGDISTDAFGFIKSGFGIILAASGAGATLLIIRAGYKIMTSEGNQDTVKEGREQLTAAIIGLLFLIFAFVFLELIGVDLLRIPGATSTGTLQRGMECDAGSNTQCATGLTCKSQGGTKNGTCQ